MDEADTPDQPTPAPTSRPVDAFGAEVDSVQMRPAPASSDPATRVPAAHTTDDAADGDRRAGDSVLGFLAELPVLILVALVLAFLLRTFVLQVFYIPSESMLPTLVVDDRIVVEKLTYRFSDIERGEIVVFEEDEALTPEQTGVQRVVSAVGQFVGVVPANARDLVKRVIGLPGDTVRVVDGQVFVNDIALVEPYARLDADNEEPVVVPDGELFVMGDNRGNSSDSRSALGTVPESRVVGRVVFRLWPLDRAGSMPGFQHDEVPETTD